jgi:hypothetical protein
VAEMIERLRKVGLDSWLAAVAGAILILLIVQVTRYARAGTLGEDIVRASQLQPASQGRSDVKAQEEYKPLIEKGHFGKKKEEPPKPPQLFGILGNVALLGNSPDDAKPYEVGAGLPDGSKLAEIHLNSVVTEKDGEKKTIVLFPELGVKAQEPPRPAGPPPRPPDQKPEKKPPEAGGAAEQATPEPENVQPPAQPEHRPRMGRQRPSAEMRERMGRSMGGRSRGPDTDESE